MESALVLCATSISLFVSPFARPLTSYLSYPPCINRLSFRRSHIMFPQQHPFFSTWFRLDSSL
ncbi:hypothetical protein K443DRAFT_457114 [Laccaria amethystina LaAM-08-1]|uniref:Uncharacterized protein n=1 Tax=Laccaria amethystina LaAM-08-1 TaxID=1095629 RepID=A0A0C9XQG7_9AGAR|nr:hypothetical protein K443DRAFT_457114 [Laccaria amethystina LaAM-08-1]